MDGYDSGVGCAGAGADRGAARAASGVRRWHGRAARQADEGMHLRLGAHPNALALQAAQQQAWERKAAQARKVLADYEAWKQTPKTQKKAAKKRVQTATGE